VREANNLEQLSPRTDRVRERNRIAGEVAAREKIPVDDLFALMQDHPEYHAPDGVHFGPKGVAAEAAQVAQKVLDALK
jgi:lysophospholipase L1-like esterase